MKRIIGMLLLVVSIEMMSPGVVTCRAEQLPDVSGVVSGAEVHVKIAEKVAGKMSTDIIVTKYRRYKGRATQYRRWNETRGFWVDPYWINL